MMDKKITSPTVKGVIIALILIVYALFLQYSGLNENKALGLVQLVILLGGLIYCCISYAKQMDGNVTFGNVFAHGFKAAATITVLMIIFMILLFKVINPELKDIALRKVEESLADKKLSDDQIETTMGMMRKNFVVLTVGGQMLSLLVVGLISSLIGAAVAKKNPQNPFQQG